MARQAPEGPEAPETVRHTNCPKMSGAGGCLLTAELSGTGAGVAGMPSRLPAGAAFLYTNCPARRNGQEGVGAATRTVTAQPWQPCALGGAVLAPPKAQGLRRAEGWIPRSCLAAVRRGGCSVARQGRG